ncbi:hypothetical protein CDL12_07183 [Handroanthus impetiginosus]|uniref:GAGA-binding transcriptional activator n=1 Tax=Handroanthus impetiginosus TaxID=429701 RepID=A0A2G9HRG8_9LAMI|nr:hypothetical protein CDL12_07183 [Handroanthus impetiginosus]
MWVQDPLGHSTGPKNNMPPRCSTICEVQGTRDQYGCGPTESCCSQTYEMTSDPGIAAVPIRTVAPKNPGKKWERKTNYSYKMQPFASHLLKPKELKKKTHASEKAKPKSKLEVHEEERFDFSNVPSPFVAVQELPHDATNQELPGKRISGRKMSRGPYRKLLYTLAIGGRDLSQPVDLKNHWAKHGTNMFVTIKLRRLCRGPYRKLLYTLAIGVHDLSQPVDLKNHWAKHGTNMFVTIK